MSIFELKTNSDRFCLIGLLKEFVGPCYSGRGSLMSGPCGFVSGRLMNGLWA